MDLHEQLKDIKTQLRLSMNGAVSQSMREKGLVYKLNFGVELPRIKKIAEGYEKNHSLAQALWKEEIRECKILAGLLQPVESFFPEIADIWVESIPNIEIAELTSMNLFQHLPYAPAKSFQWIADERGYVRTWPNDRKRVSRSGGMCLPFRFLSCAKRGNGRHPPLYAAQRRAVFPGMPSGRRHGTCRNGGRTVAL